MKFNDCWGAFCASNFALPLPHVDSLRKNKDEGDSVPITHREGDKKKLVVFPWKSLNVPPLLFPYTFLNKIYIFVYSVLWTLKEVERAQEIGRRKAMGM